MFRELVAHIEAEVDILEQTLISRTSWTAFKQSTYWTALVQMLDVIMNSRKILDFIRQIERIEETK